MHEYEIRIFQSPGSSVIVTAEVQLADLAAIRSARRLANGRPFEVWRGPECISGLAELPASADQTERCPSGKQAGQ